MKSLNSAITSLDFYGRPIQLNYNGNRKFKTKFGALLTIISFALIIFIALHKGERLMSDPWPKIK